LSLIGDLPAPVGSKQIPPLAVFIAVIYCGTTLCTAQHISCRVIGIGFISRAVSALVAAYLPAFNTLLLL